MKLNAIQKAAIDALIAAGALEKEVPWHGLVKTATIKALIDAGLVIGKVDRNYYIPRISHKVQVHPDALKVDVKVELPTATCQVCFGEFALKNRMLVRHGWQEFGGRKRGEYNNCFHEGRCYGAGYAPFEKSCARTKWYIKHLEGELHAAENVIAAAKDPKRRPSSFTLHHRRGLRRETVTQVVQDDGGDLGEALDSYSRSPYMSALIDHIQNSKSMIQDIKHDIAYAQKMVTSWKKASV